MKAAHRVEKIDFHARLDVLAAHRSACRSRACSGQATEAGEKVAEIVYVKFVSAACARRLLVPLLIAARLFGIKSGGKASDVFMVIFMDDIDSPDLAIHAVPHIIEKLESLTPVD